MSSLPASPIKEAFARAAAENRAAFIPYITAGDPNLAATKLFVERLAHAGADIIELGVPFSDPVADGPTNQAAAERALASGTTLEGIFTLVRELRASGLTTPLALFTYLNPIYRMGLARFAAQASDAGLNGVLLVDLPPEEAQRSWGNPAGANGGAPTYLEVLNEAGLATVFLASPTTDAARLPLIDRCSTGFVYYVSRTGVTGAQAALSETLKSELVRVRQAVKNPIAVGFGISTPEQAHEVAQAADAVVVGSAIVSLVATAGRDRPHGVSDAAEQIARFTSSIVRSLSRENR